MKNIKGRLKIEYRIANLEIPVVYAQTRSPVDDERLCTSLSKKLLRPVHVMPKLVDSPYRGWRPSLVT